MTKAGHGGANGAGGRWSRGGTSLCEEQSFGAGGPRGQLTVMVDIIGQGLWEWELDVLGRVCDDGECQTTTVSGTSNQR